MQYKSIALLAASLALVSADGWEDKTSQPVEGGVSTPTDKPSPPTDKPVEGGEGPTKPAPPAETTTTSAYTWADYTSSTSPVADATTSTTTSAYTWADYTSSTSPVADATTSTTTTAYTWADYTSSTSPVADATTSTTTTSVYYWGDYTSSSTSPVADATTTTTTGYTWADYTSSTTSPVADATTSTTTSAYYWGDESSVPVEGGETSTTTTTTHWADYVPSPSPTLETPVLGGGGAGPDCGVVTVTKTNTVYWTGEPTVPTSAPPAPPAEETHWSDVPAPPAPSAPAAAPPAGDDGGEDYMAIANKFLALAGVRPLDFDAKLQANADDAATSAQGTLTHKLNPGSFGQVLAPGTPDMESFEHVFVGGWLCEVSQPGSLDCGDQTKGWNHGGQTGHADILMSSKYTKMGCACKTGIWACDVS